MGENSHGQGKKPNEPVRAYAMQWL